MLHEFRQNTGTNTGRIWPGRVPVAGIHRIPKGIRWMNSGSITGTLREYRHEYRQNTGKRQPHPCPA